MGNFQLLAYQNHQKNASDAEKIKIFKLNNRNELDKWTARISSYSGQSGINQYSYREIYSRYQSESLISNLFKAAQVLPTPSHGTFHSKGDNTIKKTKSLTILKQEALLVAHKIYREEFSSESGILHQTKFYDALNNLNIEMTGSLLYRTKPVLEIARERYAPFAAQILHEFRKEKDLEALVDLIDERDENIKSLSSETVDLLYSLRHRAVHGELDFLEKTHNHAARMAYDLLETLIVAIINDKENWC